MRTFTFFKIALTSVLLLFLFTMVSFAQKAILFEDFEAKEWAGGNYTLRTVIDNLGTWKVSGVGNPDDNDRRNGERSIRLRGNSGDNCHIQMDFDKMNGIGEASFYYASYSTHNGGQIVLYYSTDAGNSWISGGSVTAPTWDGTMLKASFTLNIPGNVRVKIVREGGLKNGTSVNIDDLNLTDFICENCVIAPVFDPPGGNYNEAVNVKITSATAGATIRYTLDGNDPTTASSVYSSAILVNKETTIKAKAWKDDMDPSSISTVIYNFPQVVNSLAALRNLAPAYTGASNVGKTVYKYTGQAVVTHVQNFQNTKYIQEGNAAIMIWDVDTNLKTVLYQGDKITNLCGTITNYFGMLRFIPIEGNCDVIDISQKVAPVKITASQLDFNHDNPIQAKVITIENVSFVQTGTFGTGKYYDLKQNNVVYDSVFYTDKYEADYIGTQIPTIVTSITGVCNFKGVTGIPTKNRMVMLDKSSDIVKITDFNKSAIKLSPNPANSFVNIVTETSMKLEIYSLLGNLVAVENLSEGQNIISVSNYPAGVYIMKLIDTSNGQSFIQKLVVK